LGFNPIDYLRKSHLKSEQNSVYTNSLKLTSVIIEHETLRLVHSKVLSHRETQLSYDVFGFFKKENKRKGRTCDCDIF